MQVPREARRIYNIYRSRKANDDRRKGRHRLVSLNTAMLQAQALIQMQSEELLRLAIDGADVDPDLIGVAETVQ